MCDAIEVWKNRVKKEEEQLIENLVSKIREYKNKNSISLSDPLIKEIFVAEEKLVMFECANNLPTINWANFI